jgi:cytochrome P450
MARHDVAQRRSGTGGSMTGRPQAFTQGELTSVDLSDPASHAERDLDWYWRLLRDAAPAYWHPATATGPGFWVVSRYEDVRALYRDDVRLTSERGNVLGTLQHGGDTAAGAMLAVTDGVRHKQLRNALLKAFSPFALAPVVQCIRTNTDARVRQAVARGRFDFAVDIAEHIPIGTICDLLGVPHPDRPKLLRLNKSALSSDDPDETYDDAWAARNEILLYFMELAERKRANPGDDVLSSLVDATIDGVPLTANEVIFNCYSLILGGDETSRFAMAGAVQALVEHPDQWLALKTGDAPIDGAVEEVLRWTTPAMHFGRSAVTDFELHGHTVRAGDPVTLWNVSANRDERAFAEPRRFDLRRTPNKHLTFGYGPHFCIGAYLARVEINALLTSLRRHAREIEITGPVRRTRSNLLGGISALPVSITAESAA